MDQAQKLATCDLFRTKAQRLLAIAKPAAREATARLRIRSGVGYPLARKGPRMDARGPLAFHGELQQNTSMPTSITVRDVPDETRNELAARAARTGRSLQEYLRSELIELARRPDPAALMERVAMRVRRMGTTIEPSEVIDMLAPERR